MFEKSLLLPYSGFKNTPPNCQWLYLPAWRHILADLNFHERCSESLNLTYITVVFTSAVIQWRVCVQCQNCNTHTFEDITYSYHFVTFHSSVFSSIGAINISSWRTVITLYKYFRCIMNVLAAVALGTTSTNWKRRWKWVGNRLWNILISCYQIMKCFNRKFISFITNIYKDFSHYRYTTFWKLLPSSNELQFPKCCVVLCSDSRKSPNVGDKNLR